MDMSSSSSSFFDFHDFRLSGFPLVPFRPRENASAKSHTALKYVPIHVDAECGSGGGEGRSESYLGKSC